MIRLAEESDAHVVADIILESRGRYVAYAPLAHTEADTREWVRTVLIPKRTVFILIEGVHPRAIMALYVGSGAAWIDQLYVKPGYTSRGHGWALLSVAQKILAPPVRLYTFQENHGARRFYERAGFVAIQFDDGSGNEERCPSVLYEWRPQNA